MSSEIRVTVLGSGTLVPDGLRNSAGYFATSGGAKIMLDCGAGTLHALARFDLPWQQITHLFISHFHVDHVGEIASLFHAFRYGMTQERTAPLTVIGPVGLNRVADGLKLAFGDRLFAPRFPVEFREVVPGDTERLSDDLILTVAKTPHTEESLAVRIDGSKSSLAYTGDTAYSDQLAEFFSDADLLISECSFQEPRVGVPHLTIQDAARLANKARTSRLMVTHFYFEVDEPLLKAELEKGYSGEVIIGRDGMTICL